MNIQRKLKKIQHTLREIALEMEIGTSKPKDRKGDWVEIDPPQNPESHLVPDDIFIARLASNPDKYSKNDKEWHANFEAENYDGEFFGFQANWNGKEWVLVEGMYDDGVWRIKREPLNWNPPV